MSEKSPDHLCPISSEERAVCVEYLNLESGGGKLSEPAGQEALDQQALRRPQTDTPNHGQPGFVLEHSQFYRSHT